MCDRQAWRQIQSLPPSIPPREHARRRTLWCALSNPGAHLGQSSANQSVDMLWQWRAALVLAARSRRTTRRLQQAQACGAQKISEAFLARW